ncbi:MAG: hypothetical protein HYR48_01645 [Gemmatimonadetes bacterium]|nr:hypothetical protein [Gemmatimonadota bacterium]
MAAHEVRRRATALAATFLLYGSALAAQTPADTLARRQQRALDSLAAAVRALQARLDSLARARADSGGGDELAAIRAAAAVAADSSATAAASQPRQAGLGLNALNPEISVTAIVHASLLRPGPQTESFDAREFEFSFQSALDPYSYTKIFASITEEGIEVEEGYAYWSGLPGHFRLDVGKFRQNLGELNRWHRHALPEGELPLVHRSYLGDEGLASTGVSLYWPLPFSGRRGTYELFTQATRGTNEGLFAGGDRVSWLSQVTAFWQLSRATYAQVSLGGVAGTNPDSSLKTTLGVVGARFTWRPPAEAKYKEFTARGELFALRRRFDNTGPTRVGGYVGAQVRLNRRWIVGGRADYVESPDTAVASHQWETHATLTFWQSEFVYLRAEWTHHRDTLAPTSNRLALHAVWAMGPHKHELF